MFAISAKQILYVLGLAIVCGITSPAFARCGTQVICYADQNDGNTLDYCETPEGAGIVHIEGVYHDRGPRGSFHGGGDMLVKDHTITRGHLRINYPGWGLMTSAGPLLEGGKGTARRLAWIDIQHELAGDTSPLSGVRVTINLALGCVISERLVYNHCELVEWGPGQSPVAQQDL